MEPTHFSETSIHWDFITPFLKEADVAGNKLDVGAGGQSYLPAPVISLDRIHGNRGVNFNYNIVPGQELPFGKHVFGWVHCSHLLEDFAEGDWQKVFKSLVRSLTYHPNGLLTILVPDRAKFRANVAAGAPDNLDHKHEFDLCQISDFVRQWTRNQNFQSVCERHVGDYSILYVGRKVGYIE